MTNHRRTALLVLLSSLLIACGQPEASDPVAEGVNNVTGGNASSASGAGSILTPSEQGLPPELQRLETSWVGDFDGMRERRVVRVLTVFSKGFYFLDGPDQRGATYELIRMFEKELNENLGRGEPGIHVLVVPVTRDRLFSSLEEGYGDIAAANLTITPGRLSTVDFGDPLATGVDEIVVTGPGAEPLSTIDDLAGREIFVRPSSSYHESLLRLNARLKSEGKAEVVLRPADEFLQDDDLLEMVNAGLLPLTIVDSTKAEFWSKIFDHLVVHSDLAVSTDGQIAWAFRKNSPQLRQVVNEFVRTHRQGTLTGNVVLNRYLRNTEWVQNALNPNDVERFRECLAFFRRYAGEYDFDWLMVAAQGYQESRLDQSVRSAAGAVGVMQLLPSTAGDPNVGIPDITGLENNIHAGVKYLDFLRDRYFSDPEISAMNQMLFAFAAYNGGPARIAQLRKEAATTGLDPNVWFNNVEVIAAKRIGRETVQYVSNISKYYVAYRLIADQFLARDAA